MENSRLEKIKEYEKEANKARFKLDKKKKVLSNSLIDIEQEIHKNQIEFIKKIIKEAWIKKGSMYVEVNSDNTYNIFSLYKVIGVDIKQLSVKCRCIKIFKYLDSSYSLSITNDLMSVHELIYNSDVKELNSEEYNYYLDKIFYILNKAKLNKID